MSNKLSDILGKVKRAGALAAKNTTKAAFGISEKPDTFSSISNIQTNKTSIFSPTPMADAAKYVGTELLGMNQRKDSSDPLITTLNNSWNNQQATKIETDDIIKAFELLETKIDKNYNELRTKIKNTSSYLSDSIKQIQYDIRKTTKRIDNSELIIRKTQQDISRLSSNLAKESISANKTTYIPPISPTIRTTQLSNLLTNNSTKTSWWDKLNENKGKVAAGAAAVAANPILRGLGIGGAVVGGSVLAQQLMSKYFGFGKSREEKLKEILGKDYKPADKSSTATQIVSDKNKDINIDALSFYVSAKDRISITAGNEIRLKAKKIILDADDINISGSKTTTTPSTQNASSTSGSQKPSTGINPKTGQTWNTPSDNMQSFPIPGAQQTPTQPKKQYGSDSGSGGDGGSAPSTTKESPVDTYTPPSIGKTYGGGAADIFMQQGKQQEFPSTTSTTSGRAKDDNLSDIHENQLKFLRAIGATESSWNKKEAYSDKYNQPGNNANVRKGGKELYGDYGYFQNNAQQVKEAITKYKLDPEIAKHLHGGGPGGNSTPEQQTLAMHHYLSKRWPSLYEGVKSGDPKAINQAADAMKNTWFGIKDRWNSKETQSILNGKVTSGMYTPDDQKPQSNKNSVGMAAPWTSLEKPPTKSEIDAAMAKGTKYFDFDPKHPGAREASEYINSKGGQSIGYHVGGGSAAWGEPEVDLTSERGKKWLTGQVKDMMNAGNYGGIHLDNVDRIKNWKDMKEVVDTVEAASGGKIKVIPKNNPGVWADLFDKHPEYKKDIPYSWIENVSKGQNAKDVERLAKHLPSFGVEFNKAKDIGQSVSSGEAERLAKNSSLAGVYHMPFEEAGSRGGGYDSRNAGYYSNSRGTESTSTPSPRIINNTSQPTSVPGSYISNSKIHGIDRSKAEAAVDLAISKYGLHEGKDREIIKQYLKNGGQNLDPVESAWCAAFVNSSLEQAGIKGLSGDSKFVANSYRKWGDAVNPTDTMKGDVLVEHRNKGFSTGGHVGMSTGKTRMNNGKLQIEMISGNDNDRVKYSWRDASKLDVRRAAGLQKAVEGFNMEKTFEKNTGKSAYKDGQITPEFKAWQAEQEAKYGKPSILGNNIPKITDTNGISVMGDSPVGKFSVPDVLALAKPEVPTPDLVYKPQLPTIDPNNLIPTKPVEDAQPTITQTKENRNEEKMADVLTNPPKTENNTADITPPVTNFESEKEGPSNDEVGRPKSEDSIET